MGLLLILTLAHVLVPFATPFAAAGTSPSATIDGLRKSNFKHRSQKYTNSLGSPSSPGQSQQQQQPNRHLARHMATTAGISSQPEKSSIRKFVDRVTPGRSNNNNDNNNQEDPSNQPSSISTRTGGEEQAGIISRLLFSYASPLLKAASHRRLDVEDSFPVSKSREMDRAVVSLARIYHHLHTEAKKRLSDATTSTSTPASLEAATAAAPSESWLLTKALILHQRRTLVLTGFLRLLNTMVQATPAVLVSRLLRLIEAGDAQPVNKALTTAATLVGLLSVKMILENQFFHIVLKGSTQVRGAIAGLVFDKSLRLPGGGAGSTQKDSSVGGDGTPTAIGAGGVLNLMQSDAGIIESATLQFHTVWDGPLQIAIYTTLLFKYLGPSVLWGIGVLLLTIPINAVTLRILNRLSKYEIEAKDARTKRTAESIGNMKLLKLQGWEQRFADDIRGHRSEELRRTVSRGMVRALSTAISNAVPALVLVVTLTAYAKTGRPIVASTIFTAISLFNQLRFPLFFYPILIDSLANGRNAIRRISSYLAAEEIVPYVEHLPSPTGGGSIELKSGNFLWSTAKTTSSDGTETRAAPALSDVQLKVNAGEVVAVVGSVGSGKSALIKGLLGELNPVPRTIVQQGISPDSEDTRSGSSGVDDNPAVVTHGNVAYCSQEAWLPKGTIRDAIVFGREYDETRYLSAIRDAGLDMDIAEGDIGGASSKTAAASGVLSHETDVGEGGNALSGGQRARVALARALYAGEDTKVFLLDDCLAALDASVGSIVFERLTKRLRGSNAATVIVTNDPSLPRRCDRVVLMGRVAKSSSCSEIVDVGTYDDLIRRGHDLQSISAAEAEAAEYKDEDEGSEDLEHATSHMADNAVIDPMKLMKIGEDTIRLVGGSEAPANYTESWSHADPESQMAMENFPDCIAEQVSHKNPVATDADGFHLEDDTDADTEDEAIADSDETAITSVKKSPSKALQKKIASADDEMGVGAVPWSTYVSYFKAAGKPLLVVAMLSSYLLANGAQFYQQYTVAKWTEVGAGDAIAGALAGRYLRSLVNAAGVVSVFLWIRSYLTMKVGVSASAFFHSRMLSSVFAAPMSFFDATPSGQLLSRFGKEIETVDRGVPDSIGSVLFCFLQIFFSAGALAGVVTPGMLIPLGIVGIFYVKTMSMFRPAARDMKRVETKTRSPIYTHFGEALRGTETIRSIPGAQEYWSSQHRSFTDTNLSVFYTVKALDRWLSTRLETLGNTIVLTAAIASVFLTRAGRLKAGSAGWGLTQALSITGLMTWAVRCMTDIETNMMSVMRVKELTDIDSEEVKLDPRISEKKRKMPKEQTSPGEAMRPLLSDSSSFNATMAPMDNNALLKDGWPWRGNIQFSNTSMRYNSASPLVLDGVTLTVPAGTTLGVVGRTGSGKSSLLLTLFRLVEIEEGGSIEIDGVDIRSISLQKLRDSLAIIPQDPVLFAGSIAYNLDASGKASPEDMWAALEAAAPGLKEQFRSSNGLDTYVSEGGKNLSLGQRQLICLARALLKKSRILVLDEATSSVDARTDQEVQETIRREFVDKGVTVITVAHRLDTVLGYDKIAVLGAGRILEYGSPAELLRVQKGELRRLVDADSLSKRKGGSKKESETLVAAAA
jgi:ATP-binding cassette subfamily C (CFTR/MRP) protein 1